MHSEPTRRGLLKAGAAGGGVLVAGGAGSGLASAQDASRSDESE